MFAAVPVLAALLGAGAPEPSADFARGQVVEKVAAAKVPGQSYALYLPSTYTPERLWPVLYMLDARNNALVPIERFRAAAERFGWILVSSYNSRSDTRDDPNSAAMTAMWNDAVARFSIDGRRVYVTGFSGGARAAVDVAYALPGRVTGVIGAGAGFADSQAAVKKVPFAYFGTVGDRDMNYYEMRELEEKLEKARAPHRIVYFEGGHEWMSPELAGEGVAWMELQAMKAGVRPKDPETIAVLHSAARSRAAALEAEGKRTEAFVAYTHAAEDFRGLADESTVEEDERQAEQLGTLPEVQASLKEARRRDARDEATLRSVNTRLRNALSQPDPPLPALLAADLGIPALRQKAASASSPEERLSADRILANLRAQTGFYLPEDMLARKDTARGRALLLVRAEIDPDNPLVYYNVACFSARSGDAARAIKDLQHAVEKGFTRFELIDTDTDFDPIRQDEAFGKWLAAARPAGPAPATP
ncbi:MAG: dienelactone hydrolase family protein [Thermoanaerobaculia bacterium]